MKRRQWTSEKKALVVLEGLRGRPVAALCSEHGISQSQYYQWRDQFLHNAARAFETEKTDQKTLRLKSENERLKSMVGELTMELKKSEEWE